MTSPFVPPARTVSVAQWVVTGQVLSAMIDGVALASIPADPGNADYRAVLASGETIEAAPTPPAAVPTCALWQLQAVMTNAQWTAAQAAVAAIGNPALSAFFAHGTNVIPANSTTLISLGATLGLSADQVTALVAAGAEVAIP